MTHSDMDIRRKEFFNSHADNWLDTFYKNPETGKYDRFDQKFSQLFNHISLCEGDSVIDAGCGAGVLVPYILQRIGLDGRLYEVDYSENMIAVNRKLHEDTRITFLTNSIEKLSISSGSVDVVICFACFPHFQDKTESLKEIGRLLRQGGKLTIAHFDSSENINNHHRKHECVMHDRLPSENDMRGLLSNSGFHVELFIDRQGFYCICAVKE